MRTGRRMPASAAISEDWAEWPAMSEELVEWLHAVTSLFVLSAVQRKAVVGRSC